MQKCGQQVSDIAGERWRRHHRTELDGDKWFVTGIRHKVRSVNLEAYNIVMLFLMLLLLLMMMVSQYYS